MMKRAVRNPLIRYASSGSGRVAPFTRSWTIDYRPPSTPKKGFTRPYLSIYTQPALLSMPFCLRMTENNRERVTCCGFSAMTAANDSVMD